MIIWNEREKRIRCTLRRTPLSETLRALAHTTEKYQAQHENGMTHDVVPVRSKWSQQTATKPNNKTKKKPHFPHTHISNTMHFISFHFIKCVAKWWWNFHTRKKVREKVYCIWCDTQETALLNCKLWHFINWFALIHTVRCWWAFHCTFEEGLGYVVQMGFKNSLDKSFILCDI